MRRMSGRVSRTVRSFVSMLYRALSTNADCLSANLEQLYAFYYSLPRPPSSQAARDAALAQNTSNPISPLSSSPELPQHVSPSSTKSASGWDAYNARTEFSRQGVGIRTKAWRFTDINKDYSFSPTYPGKLVVPSRISDSVLAYAGKYRSKARIPTLTYLHWANQVSTIRIALAAGLILFRPPSPDLPNRWLG